MEALYDAILTNYEQQEFPKMLGESGHFLYTALLTTWKERGYPDTFKIGNHDLSEKCGTLPPNIPKLRDRVLPEVVISGHTLMSYKSMGRSRPGVYKINSSVLKSFEPMIESVSEPVCAPEPEIKPEPVVETTEPTPRRKRGRAWDIVPFKGLPKLGEAQGMSAQQVEKLDQFGLRHLRSIDVRYYTPSSRDTSLLYELFRRQTPRQIKDAAELAKSQGSADFLSLAVGGTDEQRQGEL